MPGVLDKLRSELGGNLWRFRHYFPFSSPILSVVGIQRLSQPPLDDSPHGPLCPNCWRFFETDSGCVVREKARGRNEAIK